jgi:transglutaminase-like putative cysteine protease
VSDRLQQIPRRALLWLTAALLLAMGPHLLRQPGWLPLVFAFSAAWRYQVWSGRRSLPGWPVKVVLVLLSMAGVLLAYGTLVGVDPAMALLVIGCALKLIEFTSHRDYIVLAFLAYFIAACNFIYEQEIPTTLYVLLALTMVSAALIARHQSAARPFVNPGRLAAKLVLQSLPLMVLLFVVFPRIGPLWSIPQPENHAKTGPSDNMSPGDVANLSRSDKLAFRVTFDGAVPPQRELYWRGLVFSEFDGRVWKRDRAAGFEARLARNGARRVSYADRGLERSARAVSYEVILEPTWQNWAFALEVPVSVDDALSWGSDFSLIAGKTLTQRIRYEAVADPDARFGTSLRTSVREQNTQLPEGFNPLSRERARDWFAESGDDPRRYIDRLLDWFNRQNFVYTLSPPLLGRDTVDEFLFETRRGFCEHYAGSFVFMLRAAGIPSRVVVGYQGGELHSTEGYVLVHQYDAHAWAEAWLEGEGWVRFDPTAAVAPERVERSLQDYFGSEFLADDPLSLARYRDVALVNWLRMRWDMLGYHWANFVLGYDDSMQFGFLKGLLGSVTPQRMVLFFVGSAGIIVLLLSLGMLRGRVRRKTDPATRLFLRFCRRMERLGVPRRAGEGPVDFARRVGRERPEWAGVADEVARSYSALVYGGEGDLAALRRAADAANRWRPPGARAPGPL